MLPEFIHIHGPKYRCSHERNYKHRAHTSGHLPDDVDSRILQLVIIQL